MGRGGPRNRRRIRLIFQGRIPQPLDVLAVVFPLVPAVIPAVSVRVDLADLAEDLEYGVHPVPVGGDHYPAKDPANGLLARRDLLQVRAALDQLADVTQRRPPRRPGVPAGVPDALTPPALRELAHGGLTSRGQLCHTNPTLGNHCPAVSLPSSPVSHGCQR